MESMSLRLTPLSGGLTVPGTRSMSGENPSWLKQKSTSQMAHLADGALNPEKPAGTSPSRSLTECACCEFPVDTRPCAKLKTNPWSFTVLAFLRTHARKHTRTQTRIHAYTHAHFPARPPRARVCISSTSNHQVTGQQKESRLPESNRQSQR